MKNMSQPGSTMISVVVPVYCGSDYLEALVAALDELRRDWLAQEAPFVLWA